MQAQYRCCPPGLSGDNGSNAETNFISFWMWHSMRLYICFLWKVAVLKNWYIKVESCHTLILSNMIPFVLKYSYDAFWEKLQCDIVQNLTGSVWHQSPVKLASSCFPFTFWCDHFPALKGTFKPHWQSRRLARRLKKKWKQSQLVATCHGPPVDWILRGSQSSARPPPSLSTWPSLW